MKDGTGLIIAPGGEIDGLLSRTCSEGRSSALAWRTSPGQAYQRQDQDKSSHWGVKNRWSTADQMSGIHGDSGGTVHRWTGTKQVAISECLVDASDRRPELVITHPGCRKCCLLARIGPGPFRLGDDLRRVRRLFQDIPRSGLAAVDDLLNFTANRNQRVAESVRAQTFDSLSVGSIIKVPATGNDTVGA